VSSFTLLFHPELWKAKIITVMVYDMSMIQSRKEKASTARTSWQRVSSQILARPQPLGSRIEVTFAVSAAVASHKIQSKDSQLTSTTTKEVNAPFLA
jgi:hypothetical protein